MGQDNEMKEGSSPRPLVIIPSSRPWASSAAPPLAHSSYGLRQYAGRRIGSGSATPVRVKINDRADASKQIECGVIFKLAAFRRAKANEADGLSYQRLSCYQGRDVD